MVEVAYKPHIVIHYTDTLSPHTMTLYTRAPVTPVQGVPPNYQAWDTNPIAADVMVENLVTALLPNVLPMTTFVSYDVYDAPDAELPPVWLYTAFLTSQVGTLVDTGDFKAHQWTMSFRTTNGNGLRVVQLNTPTGNTFGNVVGLSARDADIATEILSPANAWSGKSGGQPLAFTNISISLNKRLRRKYNMI